MNGIINIKLANEECRCFLTCGTSSQSTVFSLYHKHNYAEIHIISKGEMQFYIDKQVICAKSGSAVLIPPCAYHYVKTVSESVSHSAFQIECSAFAPAHKVFPLQIIDGFFLELKSSLETENFARLSPYISLICTSLFDNKSENTAQNRDYAFIINEFFSSRYSENITVEELARELCLSEKQTQRLVTKHTGKTFGQNLLDQRMKIADYLIENTDMMLNEVARYVGYSSYAGFFKARKKRSEKE